MAIESKMPRGPFGRQIENSVSEKTRSSKKPFVIWSLVIIILVGLAWLVYQSGIIRSFDVDASTYQAVFLDNGQVYFGKLDPKSRNSFYELTDVFYITNTAVVELNDTANLSLRKLGAEAHGPTDMMLINRDHILFVENIKPDSKVFEAISSYKSRK